VAHIEDANEDEPSGFNWKMQIMKKIHEAL